MHHCFAQASAKNVLAMHSNSATIFTKQEMVNFTIFSFIQQIVICATLLSI